MPDEAQIPPTSMVLGNVLPEIEATTPANEPTGGGGASGPPDMSELERRVERLETRLGAIEAKVGDLRWYVLTTGVVVAFTLFMAGHSDRQFLLERLTASDDRSTAQFDSVSSRFDSVASSFDAVNARLDAARDATTIREATEAARAEAQVSGVRAEFRATSARLLSTEQELNDVAADVRVFSTELGNVLKRIERQLDQNFAGD